MSKEKKVINLGDLRRKLDKLENDKKNEKDSKKKIYKQQFAAQLTKTIYKFDKFLDAKEESSCSELSDIIERTKDDLDLLEKKINKPTYKEY